MKNEKEKLFCPLNCICLKPTYEWVSSLKFHIFPLSLRHGQVMIHYGFNCMRDEKYDNDGGKQLETWIGDKTYFLKAGLSKNNYEWTGDETDIYPIKRYVCRKIKKDTLHYYYHIAMHMGMCRVMNFFKRKAFESKHRWNENVIVSEHQMLQLMKQIEKGIILDS